MVRLIVVMHVRQWPRTSSAPKTKWMWQTPGSCGNDFLCEQEPTWQIRNWGNLVKEASGMMTVLIASLWDTRYFHQPHWLNLLTVFLWWVIWVFDGKRITMGMFSYLHLDAGNAALLSPVHGVWYISAWCPSKGRWCPLDVSGRSECGKRLQDLLWCL